MHRQLTLPFADDGCCGRWQYLLIASPDPAVTAAVMKVKEDFYAVYKQRIATGTRPHITVAHFTATEKSEAALVELMRETCSKHPRFIAGLQNFDGFEPSTLYINVQAHEPFRQLAGSLSVVKDCLRTNRCPAAYLVSHPHLTVARRLPHWVYAKAIREYRSRCFEGAFVVNELLLLKKRQRSQRYERVTTLRLSPSNSFLN